MKFVHQIVLAKLLWEPCLKLKLVRSHTRFYLEFLEIACERRLFISSLKNGIICAEVKLRAMRFFILSSTIKISIEA